MPPIENIEKEALACARQLRIRRDRVLKVSMSMHGGKVFGLEVRVLIPIKGGLQGIEKFVESILEPPFREGQQIIPKSVPLFPVGSKKGLMDLRKRTVRELFFDPSADEKWWVIIRGFKEPFLAHHFIGAPIPRP